MCVCVCLCVCADQSEASYLAAQQQTLAHVGHADHEAGLALVVGHQGVLAELHRLAPLLGPGHLQAERGGGGIGSDTRQDKQTNRQGALCG